MLVVLSQLFHHILSQSNPLFKNSIPLVSDFNEQPEDCEVAKEIDEAAGREVAGGRGVIVGTADEASSTNSDITGDVESSGDGGIAFGVGQLVRDAEATSRESAGDIEGVADEISLGVATCVLFLPLLLLVVAAVLAALKVKSIATTFAHSATTAMASVCDGAREMANFFCPFIVGGLLQICTVR